MASLFEFGILLLRLLNRWYCFYQENFRFLCVNTWHTIALPHMGLLTYLINGQDGLEQDLW